VPATAGACDARCPLHSFRNDRLHIITVWPEEPNHENERAYPAVAPGGDTYVAWERNLDTNFFNGDPYIYEHLALVPADANAPVRGGKHNPVDHQGTMNGTPVGGVRSLDAADIAGYNRGTGNDFPYRWNQPSTDHH
jgi:hypothetical protein